MGSNTINMFLLAIIDIAHRNQRLLRKAALKHALTGSLAVFMIGLVVFLMLADIDVKIGWVGIDSLLIITAYVVAVRLIQGNPSPGSQPGILPDIPDGTASLRKGIIGFSLSAGVLIAVTPIMVESADEIAMITGLGTTFIGTTLVALVTSLPELVTTMAAIKIGADDMAIGNLFGSNMFNMFAIGLTDIFFTQNQPYPMAGATRPVNRSPGIRSKGPGKRNSASAPRAKKKPIIRIFHRILVSLLTILYNVIHPNYHERSLSI